MQEDIQLRFKIDGATRGDSVKIEYGVSKDSFVMPGEFKSASKYSELKAYDSRQEDEGKVLMINDLYNDAYKLVSEYAYIYVRISREEDATAANYIAI